MSHLFTVILIKPDYMHGNDPDDMTEVVHVKCSEPDMITAAHLARVKAAQRHGVEDPDDFAVAQIFPGHQQNIWS